MISLLMGVLLVCEYNKLTMNMNLTCNNEEFSINDDGNMLDGQEVCHPEVNRTKIVKMGLD